MKTIETNKNTAAKKTPATFRDFRKVGTGSIPGEKEVASKHKQPEKNPGIGTSAKLKL